MPACEGSDDKQVVQRHDSAQTIHTDRSPGPRQFVSVRLLALSIGHPRPSAIHNGALFVGSTSRRPGWPDERDDLVSTNVE